MDVDSSLDQFNIPQGRMVLKCSVVIVSPWMPCGRQNQFNTAVDFLCRRWEQAAGSIYQAGSVDSSEWPGRCPGACPPQALHHSPACPCSSSQGHAPLCAQQCSRCCCLLLGSSGLCCTSSSAQAGACCLGGCSDGRGQPAHLTPPSGTAPLVHVSPVAL